MPEFPLSAGVMILCAICGNKRCPHAQDHRLRCTGSNEPDQEGEDESWEPIFPDKPIKSVPSITVESTDPKFMCRLVEWLNRAEAESGSTRILINN